MEPYLFIDEKEWKYILETYEKDDVIEELSKALHTYPCPIPEISEKDTRSTTVYHACKDVTRRLSLAFPEH